MHTTETNDAPIPGPRPLFVTTRWSVVVAAADTASAPAAREALETLCRAYWPPLYAYVRRCGQSAPDAEDLTQEFFARLIDQHWLGNADRERGRLRTFLIVALKRFMSKEWRRSCAQRRGGGAAHVPFDTALTESRPGADPATTLAPEEVYDRQWALTLLKLALQRLNAEFQLAGKSAEFEQLKDCLTAAHGALDYAAAAGRLGISEGAARVAVHRLRKRFRQAFREEIARTLSAEADVEAELHYLAGALARQ